MNLKGFPALVVCLAVAGVAVAEDGMGHSRPKSIVAYCASSSADISWDKVIDEDLTGYNVYRQTMTNPVLIKSNSELVTTESYTAEQLPTGVAFGFSVTAVYSDGVESEKSELAICTTG